MSEDEGRETVADAPANGQPQPGSLHARMRDQQESALASRTEKFPVPNWGHLVHVELRPLGWDTIQKVNERHAKIRDRGVQNVYVAADHLIAATVGFWEVDENGDPTVSANETWITLARGALPAFPEDGSSRQALLALVRPSSRVVFLWNDWLDWADSEKSDVDEELSEDFAKTR